MRAQKVLAQFEKTAADWRAALEGRSEECFAKKTEAAAWTLGQVCDHVIGASGVFMDQVDALVGGQGTRRRGSFMAAMFTRIGSFPPGRFKVPPNLPPQYARLSAPEPMTKAEALQGFTALEARTREACAAVGAAPTNLRSKHPAAGWANAVQWYKLSEMHMRHHLRQLRRIQKALG